MKKLFYGEYPVQLKEKLKKNSIGLSKKSGRSNSGKVSIRHKGSGKKNLFKKVSFSKNLEDYRIGLLEKTEFHAKKGAFLSRTFDFLQKKHFYAITGCNKIESSFVKASVLQVSKNASLRLSNRLSLSKVPIGTLIFNLVNDREKISLASGCFCVVLQKTENICKIRLPSNSIKKVSIKNFANIGRVTNTSKKFERLENAGKSRWLGIRPSVRGVAMNPNDHPNGGGEGKKVGKYTPWGKRFGVSSNKKKFKPLSTQKLRGDTF
jgi:large subunit ribosomal protein L2